MNYLGEIPAHLLLKPKRERVDGIATGISFLSSVMEDA